jgi:hypothetical protein
MRFLLAVVPQRGHTLLSGGSGRWRCVEALLAPERPESARRRGE